MAFVKIEKYGGKRKKSEKQSAVSEQGEESKRKATARRKAEATA